MNSLKPRNSSAGYEEEDLLDLSSDTTVQPIVQERETLLPSSNGLYSPTIPRTGRRNTGDVETPLGGSTSTYPMDAASLLLKRIEDEFGGEYIAYTKRFHMLFIFCLLILANAIIWVLLAPIADLSADYYHVRTADINFVALTFQILFIPGTFLSLLCMEKLGLRSTLLIGAFLTMIASILR